MIEIVEDPTDTRLEPYQAVRERDLVGREGRFILEGRVVLEKAVRAMPAAIESVLLAANRRASMAATLASLNASTPVFVASQTVMDTIVGFPIHRGILAVGRRVDRDAQVLLSGAARLVVGLVGVANHDNMGGVFRNAAAFGADAVLLDDSCNDPLYRKAIRVSVGASLTVPFAVCGSAGAMVDRLALAEFEVVALSPSGAETLAEYCPARRTALLFGAEGPGLPPEILTRVRTLRVPMAGGFDSLNLATTSGIVLHHVATWLAGSGV